MAGRGWLWLVRPTYIPLRTLPLGGMGQTVLLTGDPLGPGAPLSPCKQEGQISFVAKDHMDATTTGLHLDLHNGRRPAQMTSIPYRRRMEP